MLPRHQQQWQQRQMQEAQLLAWMQQQQLAQGRGIGGLPMPPKVAPKQAPPMNLAKGAVPLPSAAPQAAPIKPAPPVANAGAGKAVVPAVAPKGGGGAGGGPRTIWGPRTILIWR